MKCGTQRYWVYFERLRFLDSFIQPRSTFTNDTSFDEDKGTSNNSDLETDLVDESESNIEIQLEDGIEIDELELQDGGYEKNGNDEHLDENMDKSGQHTSVKRVISKYTGEVSTFTYVSTPSIDVRVDQQHDSAVEAVDNEIPQEQIDEPVDGYMSPYSNATSTKVNVPSRQSIPTTAKGTSARINPMRSEINELSPTIEDSFDMDDYVSPHPGTSASQKIIPPSCRKLTPAANQLVPNASKPKNILSTLPPSKKYKSNANRSAVNQSNETSSNANTVPIVAPTNPATTASKDQRIEAIRQQMESCLTAITNKVTEKSERSPYAPFLAYLGTKLSLVSQDILPNLEREILELVNQHSI
ncbi:uncharacterized protein LOC119083739 [Bradysia coprophila]|uniref:uncharacterized protein LOC119083048 n=1 Tax=Bradysia coprophila TaxID=38358 RepID=UPI00187D92AD|nr:uncharacterized protein LOC119083048 [Bradysia coprophila]XP_037049431.1 uncharacterized protein LOC119083739 [Bradysia coprophila]